MRYAVGVDGTRRGWLSVRLRDGRISDATEHRDFGAVLAGNAESEIIAVDIPIGLPSPPTLVRRADAEATAFVGPRRASVFQVPPRDVLLVESYPDALELCIELTGRGLSKQAHALRLKILEVDGHTDDERIREIHPEVSFKELSARPLRFAKRTWNGYQERREALRRGGIAIPPDLGEAVGDAAVDDVLDAVVAAWSAARIAREEAQHLPADASEGEPRIWY